MSSSLPLPDVATTAFFFDFDGTLCALAPSPDAVVVSPRVPVLLNKLVASNDAAVAIVSGRPIADIDKFLTPLHLPVAGSHGAEFRDVDGSVEQVGFGDPRLEHMRASLQTLVSAHPGLLLEMKSAGLAVHYRAAPQHAAAVEAATQQAVAEQGGAFVLQPGKMVFEIKPKGVDKGRAIRRYMEAAPFAGKMPVFVGDDLTDEKGFAVIDELGGLAVKIGEGDTIAAHRLPAVNDLLDWLERIVGMVGKGQPAQ